MGFSAFDERQPVLAQFVIHDTDGTALVQAILATSGPVRIDTWLAQLSDTVNREFVVEIQNPGGTYQGFCNFTVPAGAGTGGLAPFDVLAAILPPTTQGLVLPSNQSMQVKAVVALSAGKSTTQNLIGGLV